MGVGVGCQGVHDKGRVRATQPPYLFVKSLSPVLPPPPLTNHPSTLHPLTCHPLPLLLRRCSKSEFTGAVREMGNLIDSGGEWGVRRHGREALKEGWGDPCRVNNIIATPADWGRWEATHPPGDRSRRGHFEGEKGW